MTTDGGEHFEPRQRRAEFLLETDPQSLLDDRRAARQAQPELQRRRAVRRTAELIARLESREPEGAGTRGGTSRPRSHGISMLKWFCSRDNGTCPSALSIGYRVLGECACTAAAREGVTAFGARRAPDFSTTG
jgi:hypothetical protein